MGGFPMLWTIVVVVVVRLLQGRSAL